jgi:hypothetical protein
VKRPDAAIAAAVVLFVVYCLTLAPSVTFWDAGEFIAAAHSLGIPHPPGTPLFVLLANVWAKVVPLPFATATNLMSAAATAGAAFVTARMVQRGTSSAPMAFAAAIAAGAMSTAWFNATETEVYAVSLVLGMLTIWAGERAGRDHEPKWIVLTAYLIALAVPLHLSALVTAPVAIVLAAGSPGAVRWRTAALLGGTLFLALGVGRMSLWMASLGAVIVVTSAFVSGEPGARPRLLPGLGLSAATLAVAAAGCSAILFLLVRAQFDPGINQGNPDTWERLAYVVSRRQYAVAPIWPRMTAPWIQLANIGQYADWQVALSTGPTVMPSVLRTLGTGLFLWMGATGAAWHYRADRRSWLAVAALFACGTLGVMVYLNLRAGPSIGFPGLASDAMREARERDYFYVFGFWAWGIWAGIGAVVSASEWRRPAWTGILVAALPIALNWRAVNRRAEGEGHLPRLWAEALLESTPSNGVLFVSGDNDTYPLWYSQEVSGIRRDVAVVTLPLLATRWYRDEMARRHGLRLSDGEVQGRMSTAAALADAARRQNRPVATSITLMPSERLRIGPRWTAGALVYVEGGRVVDSVAAAQWSSWVREHLPRSDTRRAIDPVASYFRAAMECPRLFGELGRTADTAQLDSTCNYR